MIMMVIEDGRINDFYLILHGLIRIHKIHWCQSQLMADYRFDQFDND